MNGNTYTPNMYNQIAKENVAGLEDLNYSANNVNQKIRAIL